MFFLLPRPSILLGGGHVAVLVEIPILDEFLGCGFEIVRGGKVEVGRNLSGNRDLQRSYLLILIFELVAQLDLF